MASNDALSVLLAVATASAALALGSVTRPSISPRRGTRKASAARSRGGGVEGSATGAVDEDEQLETASTMSAPQKLVPAIQPVAKIIPLDMWAVLCDVVSGKLERNDIRAVATMARMGYSGKLPDVLFSAYTQSADKTPALKLYFLHRQHTVEAADGSKQRVPSKYGRVMACDLHENYARVFAKKGSIDKRPTLLETLRECSPDWPIHQVPRIVTFTFRLRDRKIVVFSIPGTANLGDLMVDGSSFDSLRGMLHMIPRGMTLVPQVDGSIAVGTKTYMQSAQDAFQKTASKTALMMYHPGFCSYGGNAFNMIKSHLEGAHAKHPPDEVWLYGHSLGGASAMISTGALWHAYNHKLYPGPVLEAHVDGDNSQPFDAQAYLDKIDSMNPAVMRTDSTQGILHDDDTQGVVQDDSTQDILHDDGTQGVLQDDSTQDILHDDGTQGVVQDDSTQDILHEDGTRGVMQDDAFGHAHGHTLSHILSKIDAMRVNRVLREYYDSTQGVGQAASVQDGYSSDLYSSEGFSSDEYSSDEEKSDIQSAGASWLPQVVKPQTSTEEERVSLATVTPSVLNSHTGADEFEQNMDYLIEGMQSTENLPMRHPETMPHIHCMALAAPSYCEKPGPLSPASSNFSNSFTMTNFINQGDGIIFNRMASRSKLMYPASCSSQSPVGNGYGVVHFGILDARNDATYPCKRMGWLNTQTLDVFRSPLARFVHSHFMNKDGFVCVGNKEVVKIKQLLLDNGFEVRFVKEGELAEGLLLNAA